jgi:hypothetical protein
MRRTEAVLAWRVAGMPFRGEPALRAGGPAALTAVGVCGTCSSGWSHGRIDAGGPRGHRLTAGDVATARDGHGQRHPGADRQPIASRPLEIDAPPRPVGSGAASGR